MELGFSLKFSFLSSLMVNLSLLVWVSILRLVLTSSSTDILFLKYFPFSFLCVLWLLLFFIILPSLSYEVLGFWFSSTGLSYIAYSPPLLWTLLFLHSWIFLIIWWLFFILLYIFFYCMLLSSFCLLWWVWVAYLFCWKLSCCSIWFLTALFPPLLLVLVLLRSLLHLDHILISCILGWTIL